MNSQPTPATVAGSYEGQHEFDTQLRGRWLVFAWIAWLALVIPPMVVFLAGLPGYRENEYQSNLIYASSFHQIGITVDFFATYYLGVVIADAVICWSVATLVLWRKSNDWMGLLTALMLVLLGMGHIPLGPVLDNLKGFFSNMCIFLFFCLFPNGRFVPRWLRWALLLSLVCSALLNFTPFNRLFLLVGIGLVFVGMAAQLYRYFRVSPPLERQQTRWVVFGIPLGLLLKYGFYLTGLFFPALGTIGLFQLLNIFVYEHLFLCIPLSIGFALLHSGLWKKNRAQTPMPIEYPLHIGKEFTDYCRDLLSLKAKSYQANHKSSIHSSLQWLCLKLPLI